MSSLAASPNTLQASLIDALDGPHPERALEQAFLQISRSGNLPLLLAMVKALVRIGLAGLAARLLQAGGGWLAAEPQIAALADQLSAMPSGEVPRSTLESRLAANLRAAIDHQPHLSDLKSSLESLSADFRVFISARSNCFAIRDNAERAFQFVFAPTDQFAQAEALVLPPVELNTSFLMIGVPSLHVWRKIIATKSPNGYIPPIDLVETDTDVLALWLALLEDVAPLCSERVAIFAGPQAVARYREFLSNHDWRGPATQKLTNLRPRWQPPLIDQTLTDSVVSATNARRAQAKAQLERLYADRDAAFWRRRFANAGTTEPPLRILGLTSRYSTVMQFSMRDLAAAFQSQLPGCEFHIAKQVNSHAVNVNVVKAIAEQQPDIVVVINYLRNEVREAIPDNIPYVCWIQDHMPALWSREAGASITEFDLVVGHARDAMVSLYHYPPEQFIPTSNLTSPQTFSAEPIAEAERKKFQCDVSYVAHGSATPEHLVVEMAGDNVALRKYFAAILEAVRARLGAHESVNTLELLEIVLTSEKASSHRELPPEVRRTVIVPAAQRILDRVLRHQTLMWAAHWAESRRRSLRLYGRGWERHPHLARYAAGEIEHGDPLRCVYQASSLNLQVNGYGSLHQRLLDGLASGGCMLTRFNPNDFISEPHCAIRQYIRTHRVANLSVLMEHAENSKELRDALLRADATVGTRLAPISDRKRRAHVHCHLQCASMAPEHFTDEGLFRILRDGVSIPHRTAGDIDGFSSTVFRNESEFHAMLDRLVDDPDARRRLVEPMRRSILQHDTYESLVSRILHSFAFVRNGAS